MNKNGDRDRESSPSTREQVFATQDSPANPVPPSPIPPVSSPEDGTSSTPLHRYWLIFQGGLLVFPLAPILGILAFSATLLGVWQQRYRAIASSPLSRALGILSILLLLSSSFAEKPGEAFLGLANLLPFFALFTALGQLVQTPAQLKRIAWICSLSSFPVLLLGFGQMFGNWASPQFLWTILGWGLEAGGNPPGRMASTFMYANILAAYLLMVLMLELGLWSEAYSAWRKKPASRQRWTLLLLTVTILGNFCALIFTSSRNAWGVAVIGCVTFAVYFGWRWLLLGVTAAAGTVLWAAVGPSFGRQGLRQIIPGLVWRRLSGEMYAPAPEEGLRRSQWQFAWEMLGDRPLLGWGLRNFTPLYEAQTQFWFGHPHNLFLMLAAETGIPATLLLCAVVGWIVTQAVRLLRIWSQALRPQWYRNRLILLTYLVAFSSCVLFNLLDVTLFDLRVNTYGWILLGSIYGLTHRYSEVISPKSGRGGIPLEQ